VSEFNNTSGLFERPDTLELPIDEPIVSCFLSRDENTILLTGYSSNILQLKRTSLNSPFEVIDSLILPDSIGYFSSPSLSDNGELSLYASISEDFYDRLMASDLNDWDSKARKKKNEPVPELFPEGVETAGIILILERRGD